MKGMATVQILKEIEKGTGKQIHEMFDLICGTSTGGMLAVALGVKLMTLERCEEIYKNLGKYAKVRNIVHMILFFYLFCKLFIPLNFWNLRKTRLC